MITERLSRIVSAGIFSVVLLLGAGALHRQSLRGSDLEFDEPERLPGPVNSSAWDGAATMTRNHLQIFFTSNREGGSGKMDIWAAKRQDANEPFGEPVNLGPNVNSGFAEISSCISADGLTLYIGRGGGNWNIWKTTRPDPEEFDFSPVELLDAEISTPTAGEGTGSISEDGEYLWFHRFWHQEVGPDDAGGSDLWVASRQETTGEFGNPEPVMSVNTEFDESFPATSPDGRVLFFSENPWLDSLHPDSRGRDLWFAVHEEGEGFLDFGLPERLEALNTDYDEFFPWMSRDGRLLLFTSNRSQDTDGDIWQVRVVSDPPMPELFLRGDCNDDGTVNLSDATCALERLFAGAAASGCLAALNTNGDGEVNVVDPVYLLNFLFAGGPGLSAPFPDCGPGKLPADKALGCANPPDC